MWDNEGRLFRIFFTLDPHTLILVRFSATRKSVSRFFFFSPPASTREKQEKALLYCCEGKTNPFRMEREKKSILRNFLPFFAASEPRGGAVAPLIHFFHEAAAAAKGGGGRKKNFFDFTVRAHLCKPRTHFAGGKRGKGRRRRRGRRKKEIVVEGGGRERGGGGGGETHYYSTHIHIPSR